ncbi:hypothetical protein [Enterobacter sp. SLBN-59]|uniref:hypothetical protein n=1 Tax=Enterobacter sp. SLBN-59 TaxID=2940621 RepID=UPI00216A3414|nr:hypothetical protein [Enterobacter sp. SLBN-59]MCS3490655.1 hypothetical protein [Enterobacter sp. SLBN-59]
MEAQSAGGPRSEARTKKHYGFSRNNPPLPDPSGQLANSEGLNRLKQIKSILKSNRDLVSRGSDQHQSPELPHEHENIRGPHHFH